MSGSDELYPPAQYDGGWLLLAFAIVLAIIAGALVVLLLTKPRKPASTAGEIPLAMGALLQQLRGEYLAEIDGIEQQWRAGVLNDHDASAALSRSVRSFVNEYSGLEAPVLALEDLRAQGVHPALIEAVQRHWYPAIFRRGHRIDPVASLASARTVVQTWY